MKTKIIYNEHPANAIRSITVSESRNKLGTTWDYIGPRLNTPGANELNITTFGNQTHRVVATLTEPVGYDPNVPGFYKLGVEWSLPEGVINPWNFEPIRWLVVLNENNTVPGNSDPLTIQGSLMPTIEVPLGYSFRQFQKDIANLIMLARTLAGWNQYRIDLSGVVWPDFNTPGTHVITGQWVQLFNTTPLLPGMDAMPPTFHLNIVETDLLQVKLATIEDVNGVGPVLAGRIRAHFE
jgi:hypothetical protein